MRRIAVIGAGVSGLTAAYVLQREAEVTIFEELPRLGGHAHTHEIADSEGPTIGVDSGFIVYNERTYPLLTRLFTELDVVTQPTEMSMSVRCDGCGLEYAGAKGAAGLFPSSRNLADLRFLGMLTEVIRFHRAARHLLATVWTRGSELTLGEFLGRGRFSRYFRRHFITPVVSAVWSCPPDRAAEYPARYLFAFLEHHGMLSVTGSPQWRTVTGGSESYVSKLAKQISSVRTSTSVREVIPVRGGVRIRDETGEASSFDAAVIATHADQALAMLPMASPDTCNVLGAFTYAVNPTHLHTDESVLPHLPGARASWNFRMPACESAGGAVDVVYDVSRLQGIRSSVRYLVSVNGESRLRPDSIVESMVYEHPIYTLESAAAQARLPQIGDDRLVFAGAYHGWGFHEDGCRSGVQAARRLGVHW